MPWQNLRTIMEWLFSILFIIGVVTAALNLNLAGFTPTVWFLMSVQPLLLIVCTEVTQLREGLVVKKKK